MNQHHECQSPRRLTYSAILLAALGAGGWNAAVVAGEHNDDASKAMYKEKFDRADTDGNGLLSRDEFEKMKQEAQSGAAPEQSSQGLPATDHQAETIRGFDDGEPDRDGVQSTHDDHGQTTGASSGSARSGASMQNDSSRSTLPD